MTLRTGRVMAKTKLTVSWRVWPGGLWAPSMDQCNFSSCLCVRGWVLPHISHTVPPQWVCFGGLFGLKMDIHFAHFGLESGIVFESAKGAYEYSYLFNSKCQMLRTK